ncbi:suppressor APC domain-containing protein 2 [Elgaria multicarinata webbii]|uniref:suppressor APC domain-containing protein 2 n=1 Tax=Elgaria multicarinata webbii TaxID=159646 RepID=UPI002FCD56F8
MAPERGGDGRPPPGPAAAAAAAEGLPKAFLQSLRTLFDILDDRRRGYVHLREIESRWRLQPDGEARELPRGVLEGLRRAAPPSGYLTFERFVLGLRSSLLSPEHGRSPAAPAGKAPSERPGAPAPQNIREGKAPAAERGSGKGGGASRSLEKIPGRPAEQVQCKRAAAEACGIRKLVGPLQNESSSKTVEARRQTRARGEHRRHTITNGVDYAMLKQMKELEKEKDFLLQGLEVVDRAREWYHQQIHILQEHQKQLGKSKVHNDLLREGSQLNLLLPKLQELNCCLCELLSFSAKPLNPCGTVTNGPASPPLAGLQQTIHMLKEQNWLLTKEVTDKSERITQLEQEKSALIKQLFEARARSNHESNPLDSTFI